MQVRRYTFRLYPNKAQIARFERNLDLHRGLYNAALEERIDCYRKTGKTITFFDQSASIKFVRQVYPEIDELQYRTLFGTLKRLDEAFQGFFRRAKAGAGASSGFPRFKGKHYFDSWTYPADYAFSFEQVADGRFRIRGGGPKKDDTLGWVKARGAFPAEGWRPRTATIMRREGGWWLSLAVQIPARRQAGTATTTVHMDLIDRFAAVEMVGPTHGPLSGGAGEQITPMEQSAYGKAPAEGSGIGGDCGGVVGRGGLARPAEDSGIGGDCGGAWQASEFRRPAEGSRIGGDCEEGGYPGAADAPAEGPDLRAAITAERRIDEMKSARDRKFKRGSWRWRERRRVIARASARAARARKEALHVWTTQIARASASLTVISPKVAAETRSAKGSVKRPGAAVQTVASVNRAALSQAPAAAVQMLAYKAAEAGIEFRDLADQSPAVSIGRDISETKKAERKARRAVRKAA